MIKNYFKVAIRNLLKSKKITIINILGLSIGISVCLLIQYYIRFEKSYDKFNSNYENIYRLRYERTSENGEAVRFASCCPPAGLRIRDQFPEVKTVARIFRYKASVSHLETKYFEERMYFAEPEFFKIFTYKFIEGDPINGINPPNSAFISESTAKKYFGNQNPIGKKISVDKKVDYEVVGIFEDVSGNSHHKFDILLSYKNMIALYGEDIENSWGDSGVFTYLLFNNDVDLDEFKIKLAEMVDKEFGEVLEYYKLTMTLPLQPLTDIHLTSHYAQEYEVNGDKSTVNFLSIIALIIITIAWVNYINLSTAHSLTRAKETGMRKVVGAYRFQLVTQFSFEVIIINTIAIITSLIIILATLPLFRLLTGISSGYIIWQQTWFWMALIIIFVSGVLISGLYPVLILSSYKPIKVLKGKLGNNPRGLNLRKVLVVFQFTMALAVVTCTFAVYQQLSFLKNQELGFRTDRIMVIKAPRVRNISFESNVKTFKQELIKNSTIEKFCVLTEVPGRQIYWDAGAIHPVGVDETKNYQIVGIDYDFVDLFGTEILEGRNFSSDFPSDSLALILNETAVRWMGFPDIETAIGKQIDYWGIIYTVVGVMKDYHQQSPKAAFEPHIYRYLPYGRDVRGMFALRIQAQNQSNSIDNIKSKFDEFFPGNPFEYFFLDDYYNQQYKSEELLGNVFNVFSFLSILITSIGVLGLFSFLVIQRTREISIRNVMGAGIFQILTLFGKQFFFLIIISFFITLIVCYFGIDYWLNSFAVKMEINIGLFIFPLLIILSITLLTISSQVIKAAMANPADNLRYE
ncbi:MAG: ABC transporter permease [Mariniphaga sp.]|nr:ABC transporter permease [Mariniphaga sp.]